MNSLTIERPVHFQRGRKSRKELHRGEEPKRSVPGRMPRVARLLALAIRCDGLLRSGRIASHSALARLGHVTRARVSQIMNLLNLAPDIQEAILFLPKIERGRAPIHLGQLQPITKVLDWREQRRLWNTLVRHSCGGFSGAFGTAESVSTGTPEAARASSQLPK